MLMMETLQADRDATQISIVSGFWLSVQCFLGTHCNHVCAEWTEELTGFMAEVTLLHWRF
jgi:hypothetical protein